MSSRKVVRVSKLNGARDSINRSCVIPARAPIAGIWKPTSVPTLGLHALPMLEGISAPQGISRLGHQPALGR